VTITYARVRTKSAMKYLRTFKNDWRNTTWSLTEGKNSAVVVLPLGQCELEAGDGFLDVTITADSIVYTELLEDLVSNHLDRLSQEERLRYPWILLQTIAHN
jgi:hypothetical protein